MQHCVTILHPLEETIKTDFPSVSLQPCYHKILNVYFNFKKTHWQENWKPFLGQQRVSGSMDSASHTWPAISECLWLSESWNSSTSISFYFTLTLKQWIYKYYSHKRWMNLRALRHKHNKLLKSHELVTVTLLTVVICQ